MALKKVFQIDVDFQERMFAKQIAVMKGQAWNVVEALKQPDHGPLELTRRTKVCVWDDLVDVPVAVPMRVTSSEIRRNPKLRESLDMEEADIASSAPANQAHVDSLLGLAPAPADMPHPGRFEISTPTAEEAQSPGDMAFGDAGILGQALPETDQGRPTRRPAMLPKGASWTNPLESRKPRQQRRFSAAAGGIGASGGTMAQRLHGTYQDLCDDDAGDLGYATAQGQMGNQRKVIVERLEPVKTKNPVFTWC